jgi:hypothetical protein
MSWQALTSELDAWAQAGKTADFWWRDDDAVDTTPALERLIDIQRRQAAPLMLAVIPARAQSRLAARLAGESGITVVQHGWAHANHAAPGQAKAELGSDRPTAYVLGELVRGRLVLDTLFKGDWLPVLVPPHNRIAPALAAVLAPAGYVGLSTYNPRRTPPPGLRQANSHMDIMNWTTRRFAGETEALALALAHLRARREGRADPAEPTGLLTHHLAHDDEAWRFSERFLAEVAGHRAARWVDPRPMYRS